LFCSRKGGGAYAKRRRNRTKRSRSGNPEKAARDPAQIPAPDQGKDRAEEGAKVKEPIKALVKAGIEVIFEKNNISNTHNRNITVY